MRRTDAVGLVVAGERAREIAVLAVAPGVALGDEHIEQQLGEVVLTRELGGLRELLACECDAASIAARLRRLHGEHALTKQRLDALGGGARGREELIDGPLRCREVRRIRRLQGHESLAQLREAALRAALGQALDVSRRVDRGGSATGELHELIK